MNEQLLARTVAERMFTRQLHIIENLLENSVLPLRVIERQLATLCTRWTDLQESHDAYVIQFISDSIELSVNDQLIDKYSSEFVRIEIACADFISSRSIETASMQTAATPAVETNSIKLERVKFRKFDGDVRSYPKFKSEFQQFVKPLCSPKQITFVLKSYLCDSVRRETDNHDHDIDAMWERLDSKYGTIRKQIDCIMSDFKNLPVCNDPIDTLKMINIVETAESDLKCIDAVTELENSTIISYIEESMSKPMFEHWARKITDDDDSVQSKFQKLLSFLQLWKRAIEYDTAEIRCSKPIESSKLTDRKCLIHRNENHPVWRCRVFKAMTVRERYEVINSNNACTLCLEKGHSSTDCNKTFRCSSPGCRSMHNVLLHEKKSDA